MRVVATVFVALVNEGEDVWRPVEAEDLGDGLYQLSEGAVPESEVWQFAPGSIVRCERRDLSDGPALVAVERTDRL